ncbi:sulfite oxidase-like oxidoreductase [Actinomadura kijaniata]|uniref:DMSO/TMAO reductase YedYZ molybdopterin-dependent catalytic subunit n=1 Tax=Actinomadura namibiensis TaxID=182080 RepID=A0A7W3QMG3_ACTNM|nr:molybdopterin-dependent oxidoreductase [Actinomadura namibiensis]MBA8951973.1 DMSO/TMAO reductase YedYZ molybdopterin-dependent catalytic subunit [Actinomadura namibiensis]
MGLPPGQRVAEHVPFGHPEFAVRPEVPDRPAVTVTGLVRRPTQLAAAELAGLAGRVELRAGLHCVTTWSAPDLHWSGVPFAAAHAFLAERVGVRGARWVTFGGLDGYRATLALEDALAPGVLLADRLAGAPLDRDTGAPMRLVAPAHYGYKNVKHVCLIEYRRDYDAGSARWRGHPRGRVAREERSRFLPGRMWRPVWRALLPRARAAYEAGRSRG